MKNASSGQNMKRHFSIVITIILYFIFDLNVNELNCIVQFGKF